jgi:hypothetical protein
MNSFFRKKVSGDRPVRRVFGIVFPEVPVLVSEWEMAPSTWRKTGLFGAVWIEDRDQVWAKLQVGGYLRGRGRGAGR